MKTLKFALCLLVMLIGWYGVGHMVMEWAALTDMQRAPILFLVCAFFGCAGVFEMIGEENGK